MLKYWSSWPDLKVILEDHILIHLKRFEVEHVKMVWGQLQDGMLQSSKASVCSAKQYTATYLATSLFLSHLPQHFYLNSIST